MTTLNGLFGIDFNLAVIVASTSLSSKRAVLIHQFYVGHGIVRPAAETPEMFYSARLIRFQARWVCFRGSARPSLPG